MEGEAVSGSSGSDACVAYLATTDGLIAVNVDGDVTRQDLAGSAVVSVAVLLTVTVVAFDVVVLPEASRAIARSVCEPFETPVVDQETW